MSLALGASSGGLASSGQEPEKTIIGGKHFNFEYPVYPSEQLGSLDDDQLRQLAMNLWDANAPEMNLGELPLEEESLPRWVADNQGKAFGESSTEGDLADAGRDNIDSKSADSKRISGGLSSSQWWPPWVLPEDEARPTEKGAPRVDLPLLPLPGQKTAAPLRTLLPLPLPGPPLLLPSPEDGSQGRTFCDQRALELEREYQACANLLLWIFEAKKVPVPAREKLIRPAGEEGFGAVASCGRPDIARLRFPERWLFRETCNPGFASGTTVARSNWSYNVRSGVRTFAQEFQLGKLKVTEAWTGTWSSPSASHTLTVSEDGRGVLVSFKGVSHAATVQLGSVEAASLRLREVAVAENVGSYEDLLSALPVKMPRPLFVCGRGASETNELRG